MIHRELVGDIAVLTIDNAPVNATSRAVRQGLLEALTAASADEDVLAVVIIGRGQHFSAGGDVRELGKASLNQPSLLDTIAVIEAANKPIIAAISGVALGGGLELALACHCRIGKLPLKLGLPEVTLGVIPGAGGTQRLPRLVGPAQALDLITSGRHVDGEEALRIGLIDELCDGDLKNFAIESASRMIRERRPLQRVIDRFEKIAQASKEMFSDFRDLHRETWRGLLAPWLVVDAVERACLEVDGPQFERAAYLRCQSSPQRAALGYLFAARRAARKSGLDLRMQALTTPLDQRMRQAIDRLVKQGLQLGKIAFCLRQSGWKMPAGMYPRTAETAADAVDCRAVHQGLLLELAEEGSLLLRKGFALIPDEIDIVCVDQLGFPEFQGGPMFCRARAAS